MTIATIKIIIKKTTSFSLLCSIKQNVIVQQLKVWFHILNSEKNSRTDFTDIYNALSSYMVHLSIFLCEHNVHS